MNNLPVNLICLLNFFLNIVNNFRTCPFLGSFNASDLVFQDADSFMRAIRENVNQSYQFSYVGMTSVGHMNVTGTVTHEDSIAILDDIPVESILTITNNTLTLCRNQSSYIVQGGYIVGSAMGPWFNVWHYYANANHTQVQFCRLAESIEEFENDTMTIFTKDVPCAFLIKNGTISSKILASDSNARRLDQSICEEYCTKSHDFWNYAPFSNSYAHSGHYGDGLHPTPFVFCEALLSS